MPLIFTILSLIIVFVILTVVYSNSKKAYKNKILPDQIKLVHELINNIKLIKIEVLVFEKEDVLLKKGNKFKGLTIFEIGDCLDKKTDLSYEEYEDYDVLVEETFEITDLLKYLENRYMPKDIKAEINAFNTIKSASKKTPAAPFIVLSNVNGTKIANNNFLKIDAEAFTSWQSFKESCHSLHFVIQQWLTENLPDAG